jgi:hypothetical protein
MKKIVLMLILLVLSIQVDSQELIQTVRGTVIDEDSKYPLVGVQVIIIGSEPLVGCISDANGEFRLEKVPVGRISLKLTYIGYEPKIVPDIMVVSGKETVLQVSLLESVTHLDEVVVKAYENKGAPINEMALISSRSISSDETNRYAGGFNDPARIMSNFAGVNNSQDGSADIIVRGNSPKYLQWRLEGVPITNPVHFADPGGLGANGISALNNNVLSISDFYTGTFPAEFGNALSGVYDVKLRTGNKEKFESIIGVGIVGTDITAEGPFKRGYGGSFLINYRFTTSGLLNELGLFPEIGGVPVFQDGAFKLVLPTKGMGTFSVFGLLGSSKISFKDVDPGVWETPGDRSLREDIREDYNKEAHLINAGINHMVAINKNSYIKTTLAFSSDGVHDKTIEKQLESDSVISTRDNFISETESSAFRASIAYRNKLNAKNNIQIGASYTMRNQNFIISHLADEVGTRFVLADFNENIGVVNSFMNWKHRMNDQFTLVFGLHNANVLYNSKSTIEPRVAAKWRINSKNSLNVGYGMHSTMESVHNYFTRLEMPDGSIVEPNKNLGLLKAHHMVVGYEGRFTQNLRGKIELYYQYLYDLPVENNDTSFYSTINENLDIRFVELVNKGTGENYGAEITLERFFANNYYFLVNASVYESKYKALDGIERNTAFNSNYLINVLFGKEFTHLGKKKNKTFGVNTKLFLGGGRRIIPLLRDNQGNLAVDPTSNRYWDYNRTYDNYIEDIYTVTLSLSYKWNKPKRTNELFLNIDNITNNKPRLSEYYAPKEPGSVGYLTPIGIFPNLMYRIYF